MKKIEKQVRFHFRMTVVWGIILVLATTGLILELFDIKVPPLLWLLSVAFISLCSIYANMGTHWGAYQASKSEESQEDPGVKLRKGKK